MFKKPGNVERAQAMPLLMVQDVWKRYTEDSYVLREVNLEVGRGEAVIVSGPNGSGKTTLLRICAGLLRPSKGRVLVGGLDARLPEAKEKLGVVLHNPLVYPELTVMENLHYYAGLRGVEAPLDEELARRAFEELGLDRYRDRRVEELSFGWRRRSDIVRAFLGSPEILLIDEPFTGLDPTARERLARIFRLYLDNGGSILATTPLGGADIEEFRRAGIGLRAYHIVDGRLVGK